MGTVEEGCVGEAIAALEAQAAAALAQEDAVRAAQLRIYDDESPLLRGSRQGRGEHATRSEGTGPSCYRAYVDSQKLASLWFLAAAAASDFAAAAMDAARLW